MHAASHTRRAQRGVALIAFLIALVLVGSALVLERLNASARSEVEATRKTAEALKRAKAALIAYAVNDANRPGSLPCPDVNYDGHFWTELTSPDHPDTSGPNCLTRLGWLPHLNLGLSDLRDGSGERLWYAVSDEWRANFQGTAQSGTATPGLNSATPGGLSVDGVDDIVAVVVAPGPALVHDGTGCVVDQSARPDDQSDHDAVADVSAYLEGLNADGDANTYATSPPPGNPNDCPRPATFNDRIAVISRADIMVPVERRVLGEVARALTDFRDTTPREGDPRFPCMVRISSTDFAPTDFPCDVNERAGWLPLHLSAVSQVPASPQGGTFNTRIRIAWSVDAAGANLAGPSGDALTAMDSADVLAYDTGTMVALARCRWLDGGAEVVSCDAIPTVAEPPVSIGVGQRVRTYTFGSMTFTGAVETFATGTPTTVRWRRVRQGAAPSPPVAGGNLLRNIGEQFSVSVVDTVTGDPSLCVGGLLVCSLTATLSVDNSGGLNDVTTTGQLTVELEYDLSVAGSGSAVADLPAWFEGEGWYRLVLASVAPGLEPGGAAGGCDSTADTETTDDDCLVIGVGETAAVETDVQAFVVSVGAPVVNTTADPDIDQALERVANPGLVSSWLDRENAVSDGSIIRRRVRDSDFNDQVRVVAR
ncbi:MAG: hypothetical protein H6983_21640 [Ectothiorhodospiraceae bacterium]|nr:hypothetical protein [Chromatiales bacterium]MCP5156793.1 hypothetical protein [Ectothiorhodospiraceae bacterium]